MLAQTPSYKQGANCRCFRLATYQGGVPKVDVCGLAEIGNSKERHVAHDLDRFRPQGV
jgi:hypothetical protein